MKNQNQHTKLVRTYLQIIICHLLLINISNLKSCVGRLKLDLLNNLRVFHSFSINTESLLRSVLLLISSSSSYLLISTVLWSSLLLVVTLWSVWSVKSSLSPIVSVIGESSSATSFLVLHNKLFNIFCLIRRNKMIVKNILGLQNDEVGHISSI